MQSPLFAHVENQSQERYALQNAQMLRCYLDGSNDILARKGAMVAYQGMVDFDGEFQGHARRSRQRQAGESLELMRCSGQGTVYFANLAQYLHVVEISEPVTVDSSYVLAMDSSLHWDVIAVDSQYGISGSGKFNLEITGRGKLVLMTSGKPLMMAVTPERYVNVDADAIVAWTSSLRVQMQSQTSSSGVWRRRGNTGEGWELAFQGQGFALVQPSEQLPPQNAVIGQGMAAQFGMGQQGGRGQNQNNIFSNR
ncbi:AIM24 family protein [Streptomyces sp. NPDC051940]|uniref:AIM24 family protein n=1 Tax=Streptomyces sp. NPDC051940 TaxID=3155675 RepID=UPI00342ECAF1